MLKKFFARFSTWCLEWVLWIGLLLWVGFYPVQYASLSRGFANVVTSTLSLGVTWQLLLRPMATFMGIAVIYMGIKLMFIIAALFFGKRKATQPAMKVNK